MCSMCTCSEPMHPFLDNLRMVTAACYLVSGFRVSSICGFNCVTLLFSSVRGYAAKIMNGRRTSQKLDNTQQSSFLGGFMTYAS
jgi:hypothetical protein